MRHREGKSFKRKTEAGKTKAIKVNKPAGSARDPHSVTLTLDPQVYAHFEKKAAEDDRTIAKFISRHLKKYVDDQKF